MKEKELKTILKKQKKFFMEGNTLDISFRMKMLHRLETGLYCYGRELAEAVYEDLGKSRMEFEMCEMGMVLEEIRWMKKHLPKLMKVKRAAVTPGQFPGRARIEPHPYGNVLIISPWNYPVLLTLVPLADAIAAGNTAVIKPSASSEKTSAVIKKLIGECFSEDYVYAVTGDRNENENLLEQKYDRIFFTGSAETGRKVLKAAAENLTPVTLELGGKSPCIVDSTADLALAARRIVFGKLVNCGQTCVAPDYVLADSRIEDRLVELIIDEIIRQYGENPLENPDYGKIISPVHYKRLKKLIDPEKTVWGGQKNRDECRIAPVVMTGVTWDDDVMKEEIFGPVLPVLTFDRIDDAVTMINKGGEPLALYMFTSSSRNAKNVMRKCRFGGGCINDTILHLATSSLPFGGTGASGMGAYHGKAGFDEFTHYRGILKRGTWCDPGLRYQPYNRMNADIVRKIMRIRDHSGKKIKK